MADEKRVRLSAETRRAQLIADAEELLAQGGYQTLSIAALAERAGITRAGVRHHVGSKDALLIDLLTERDQRAIALLTDRMATHGARTALDELVQVNLTQPETVRLYTVLSVEALNPAHPAHEFFERRLDHARWLIGQHLNGFDRPGEEVALEILAFMDGIQVSWFRDPNIDMWARWTSFANALFAQRGAASPDR